MTPTEDQYTASSKAFFSPSFPAAETQKTFIAFDKIFPLLNQTKVPLFLRTAAAGSREKLLADIGVWLTTISDDDKAIISPSNLAMLGVAETEQWTSRDMTALMLAELWALEANAPYGSRAFVRFSSS